MLVSLRAQQGIPSAQLIPAPRLVLPGAIDSNVPMTWDLVEGEWRLSALASWGGIPALLAGPELDRLSRVGEVTLDPHPGDGVWIESVIADEGGTWYGYYHHEAPASPCGRPDRSIPRVGAAKSVDRGMTWENLGIILEAPADSHACGSRNRFVIGGVGDVAAMLDENHQDLFLFYSEYLKDPSAQGVAVARMAWADRDAPRGRLTVWQNGAWVSAKRVIDAAEDSSSETWEYPVGTPLLPASRPWHDEDTADDAFWGPSIHWNTYLEQYVMLLNRAKNDAFDNEGIYASYASILESPDAWSEPRKIMNGGGWYPQVAGLEPASGTDKLAGRRARFFLTGRSDRYVEFQRAE
jgi:hypothetical protein